MGTKTHLNPPCSDFACVGPLNRLVTGGREIYRGAEKCTGGRVTQNGGQRNGELQKHTIGGREGQAETHTILGQIYTHTEAHIEVLPTK